MLLAQACAPFTRQPGQEPNRRSAPTGSLTPALPSLGNCGSQCALTACGVFLWAISQVPHDGSTVISRSKAEWRGHCERYAITSFILHYFDGVDGGVCGATLTRREGGPYRRTRLCDTSTTLNSLAAGASEGQLDQSAIGSARHDALLIRPS